MSTAPMVTFQPPTAPTASTPNPAAPMVPLQQDPTQPLPTPSSGPVTPPAPSSGQTVAPPQAPTAGPHVVYATATPDSRLEQLCAEYARLKPQVDDATTRLKEITDSIKHEVMQRAPEGSTEAILRSDQLDSAYKVNQRVEWRLDAKGIKEENPGLYARYAQRRTSWRLDRVK